MDNITYMNAMLASYDSLSCNVTVQTTVTVQGHMHTQQVPLRQTSDMVDYLLLTALVHCSWYYATGDVVPYTVPFSLNPYPNNDLFMLHGCSHFFHKAIGFSMGG